MKTNTICISHLINNKELYNYLLVLYSYRFNKNRGFKIAQFVNDLMEPQYAS